MNMNSYRDLEEKSQYFSHHHGDENNNGCVSLCDWYLSSVIYIFDNSRVFNSREFNVFAIIKFTDGL